MAMHLLKQVTEVHVTMVRSIILILVHLFVMLLYSILVRNNTHIHVDHVT